LLQACDFVGLLQIESSCFDRVRESLVRKYANSNMSPEKHATYLRMRALKHLWHVEDVLLELKRLTPADIQAWHGMAARRISLSSALRGMCLPSFMNDDCGGP
jgi:nardilysin